jgi:hypothetical protein
MHVTKSSRVLAPEDAIHSRMAPAEKKFRRWQGWRGADFYHTLSVEMPVILYFLHDIRP